MYVVRLECKEDRLQPLQTAVNEHMRRVRGVEQPDQPKGRASIGTIAMLEIAQPGQLMRPGRAEDTSTTVDGSPLYRELQLKHPGKLLAARLGSQLVELYQRDYESGPGGVRGFELPARQVPDHMRGVAILYDSPVDMDAVFDRMHALQELTLPDSAAERRAALHERAEHEADLTELLPQPVVQEPPVSYSRTA